MNVSLSLIRNRYDASGAKFAGEAHLLTAKIKPDLSFRGRGYRTGLTDYRCGTLTQQILMLAQEKMTRWRGPC
jgi:hypothetical protein